MCLLKRIEFLKGCQELCTNTARARPDSISGICKTIASTDFGFSREYFFDKRLWDADGPRYV